jgi:hypothetical protein
MAQFSDMKPRFSKGCGGNVKIELQETDSNGQAKTLFEFFMPRPVFTEAVKDGTLFLSILQREEAEAYIATLPKGRRAGKG